MCNLNIKIRSGLLEKEFSNIDLLSDEFLKKKKSQESKMQKETENKDLHFFWSKGGYGISFDHPDLREGSPVSIEDLKKDGDGMIHFIYLGLLDNIADEPYLPNKMELHCRSPLNNNLFLEIPIYNRFKTSAHFLNGGFIFSRNQVFLNFLSENLIAKCRLLLRRDNVLNYYSQEIQIYNYSKLRDEDRWRRFDERVSDRKMKRMLQAY